MNTRGWFLLLLMSITAQAVDKDRYKVEDASSYPSKQTNSGLTIAVVPFQTAEQMKSAFGKVDLGEFGVLPVLLVMKNESGKTLNLNAMEVSYVTPTRREVAATPSDEVRFLDAPQRPNLGPGRIPNPLPKRKKKSKLAIDEIDGYAFHAKMIPAGESAHGFFYFQIAHRPGSQIYVRGIVEAASGKELLFFEVPMN